MAARRKPRLSPRPLRPAALLLLALALPACVQDDGSPNPFADMVSVSVDEERTTGHTADAQIQQQLRLIDDPVVLGFINDLGQDIVRRIEPQPFIYHFRVIEDPSLNAFALPGGYIYFHSGTILSAGSLDELAGVMAHEIAHVKGRHYARLVEASTIPNLLAQIGGILTTVATGEPGALMVSQGVNVALQLRFTREFEAEADELGCTFMARSGYEPLGMARFFDRIVAAEAAAGPRMEVPPYLYSHPDVGSRIDAAITRAERLTVLGQRPRELAIAFRAAQLRLAILLERGQGFLREARPDRSRSDPILARAEARIAADDREGALAILREGQKSEPRDPRLHFRAGGLLEELGRDDEAIVAYRKALALDPGVALNHYRIGQLYYARGDRVNATFYLEQAARRFEQGGSLQRRTQELLRRITFPPISEAGTADGVRSPGADTVAGRSQEEFRAGAERVVWWGRLAPEYATERDRLTVRWTDPAGETVQEGPVEKADRRRIKATLLLEEGLDQRLGIWRVEVLLGEDRVDRRTFRIVP